MMSERNTATFGKAVLALGVVAALASPSFLFGKDNKSPCANHAHSSTRIMKLSEKPIGTGMGDVAIASDDITLNQCIRQALMANGDLARAADNVQLRTSNGRVTLLGTVTTENERADLVSTVQNITGVKKIEDQIQLSTNSSADEKNLQ